MHRSVIAVVALLPLGLASCDGNRTGENPLSPDATMAALAAPAVPAVPTLPVRGEFRWTFNGWQLPAAGRCPAPEGGAVWVLSTAEGTGTMSHVGQVHVSGGYCLNPFTFEFVRGEVTYVAPNGDTLSGTYAGSGYPGASPNEVGWTDTVVFTGGTGRFADAEGSAFETGGAMMQFDPETGFATAGTGWGTIEGTIRYDASNRIR